MKHKEHKIKRTISRCFPFTKYLCVALHVRTDMNDFVLIESRLGSLCSNCFRTLRAYLWMFRMKLSFLSPHDIRKHHNLYNVMTCQKKLQFMFYRENFADFELDLFYSHFDTRKYQNFLQQSFVNSMDTTLFNTPRLVELLPVALRFRWKLTVGWKLCHIFMHLNFIIFRRVHPRRMSRLDVEGKASFRREWKHACNHIINSTVNEVLRRAST